MSNVKTLSTRGRKFNAKKYVVSRAWEIAKNATVAHNTSPIKVAEKGLVKPSEFFAEAMRIAWTEAKLKMAKVADHKVYDLHKVPKKNQQKIITDLATFITVKGLVKATKKDTPISVITKAVDVSKDNKIAIAEMLFNSRYGTPVAKSQNRHELKAIKEMA